MGFIFDVNQANIVAYLTTPNRPAPRISRWDMEAFLSVLAYQNGQQPELLFTSSAEARVLGRPEWIDNVKRASTRALTHLQTLDVGRREWLPDEAIMIELAELRVLLGGYHLYGLAVGSWRDDEPLRAFTTYAAISSGANALFLVPMGLNPSISTEFLDPFPAVALAVERQSDWPGIAFWSPTGIAAFAPLREAEDLYSNLRAGLSSRREIDSILEKWRRRAERVTILHLSDLHFGNDWAQEKEPYVSTHLQDCWWNGLPRSPRRGGCCLSR